MWMWAGCFLRQKENKFLRRLSFLKITVWRGTRTFISVGFCVSVTSATVVESFSAGFIQVELPLPTCVSRIFPLHLPKDGDCGSLGRDIRAGHRALSILAWWVGCSQPPFSSCFVLGCFENTREVKMTSKWVYSTSAGVRASSWLWLFSVTRVLIIDLVYLNCLFSHGLSPWLDTQIQLWL